jgi:hypothetical protein
MLRRAQEERAAAMRGRTRKRGREDKVAPSVAASTCYEVQRMSSWLALRAVCEVVEVGEDG